MIAIVTKYYGPTDSKGSRIVATENGKRVTVGYDSGLNSEDNHAAAAEAFRVKYFPKFVHVRSADLSLGVVHLVKFA